MATPARRWWVCTWLDALVVVRWMGKLESGRGLAVNHGWDGGVEPGADFLVIAWFFRFTATGSV